MSNFYDKKQKELDVCSMKNKIYKQSVYELVIKHVDNNEVSRETMYFNTYKIAKKYGEMYKKSHPKSSIQRIKELKVYDLSL